VLLILPHICVIISELYKFSISSMHVCLAEYNMISKRSIMILILMLMPVKGLGISTQYIYVSKITLSESGKTTKNYMERR
jgi:hypothetical protein